MQKVSTLVSKDIGNYLTNRSSWNIFYNAKAEGLAGDGTTDDYADLSTLINTTINGAEATIIFSPGTYKISTSITIPSNITLFLTKGSMLSPDSGKIITINGPIEAGLWKIFTGSGTIAGSMKDAAYPQWWGAVGDGIADDTAAIQLALDTARGTLYFPRGDYKVTGTGEACLFLNRKLNIVGSDANFSKIRADNSSATTSVLKIAITNNFGFTDVRNWKIENMGLAVNVGGLHGLLIKDGFQLLTCEIKNCNLHASTTNGGYSIYVENNLAHSKINLNTISHGIYMQCFDANLIEKNLFSGTKVAITYDVETGVYNNTVRDNTIVNRDGAVHIINGDLIRIINNQIELAAGQGVSESPTRSMVWVQGVDRTCNNIIIADNNFGGGTSLDYLIYIDNANKAIIGGNQLVATNIAEALFTANAKYCILKQDNYVRSEVSNPRTRTKFKADVSDSGEGNVGVLKDPTLSNSWTGGTFYKDECGVVIFERSLSAGTTAAGTLILTLPLGFRPAFNLYMPVGTTLGTGTVHIAPNGEIKIIGVMPSNGNLTIPPFPTGTTDS